MKDDSAGAGSAPCGDGPAPPAAGETWLYACYVAAKIAEYEGRMGPEQAALENRMLPPTLQTAVEPAEAPGGGGAGMEALPEQPPDEASGPMDAAIGAAAELTAALRAFKADFLRWTENERRRRRGWAGLAMAFPACLLLGLLLQVQFEVIPPHDPTRGWGGHIRATYGEAIVNCELEAMRTNGEVDCPLTVRP